MIPIVQFDPASMAIFYDFALIGSGENENLAELIDAVVRGHPDELQNHIATIIEPEEYGRELQVISAFIHEKRHFHDFVSTNYGAFRFRQFMEIYMNLQHVLHEASECGRLCVPLEVNIDPVRRRIMGLPEPAPAIKAVAEASARRRRVVERDRQVFTSRFGSFEIGGESQLEALAFLTQSRFVKRFFGLEGLAAFRDNIYDREQFSAKYEPFLKIGLMAGILPIRDDETIPDAEHSDYLEVDAALLEFAIFAALQSDHLPTSKATSLDQIETSYPGERFALIVQGLSQDFPHLCSSEETLSLFEAWEAVDAVCQTQFGLSVDEQMSRDIDWFAEQVDKIEGKSMPLVVNIAKDFLSMRRKALNQFRANPAEYVSTESFAMNLGKDVDPIYVACNSGGTLGEPPKGYSQIMGYNTADEDGEHKPWRKWWWAAIVEKSPEFAQNIIRPDMLSDWSEIISGFAPTAKLLMNGRNVRTVLGPELLFSEQQLKESLGIEFDFYPGFEFPSDEIPVDVLRYVANLDTLVCDYKNVEIEPGTGMVLSPWALRRYPELARFTIKHLGGHDIAYHHFVRDWSPWAVSDEMITTLRPLMEREAPRRTPLGGAERPKLALISAVPFDGCNLNI